MPVAKPSLYTRVRFDPTKYDVCTNYDGVINVNRIKDIPDDYYGPMGVPVTIMDYWSDTEWEFIQPMVKPHIIIDGVETTIYYRLMVRRKRRTD